MNLKRINKTYLAISIISLLILLTSILVILIYSLKNHDSNNAHYKHINITKWINNQSTNPDYVSLFKVDLNNNEILVNTTNNGNFIIDTPRTSLTSALQLKPDGKYVLDAFNNLRDGSGASKAYIAISSSKSDFSKVLGIYLSMSLLSVSAMVTLGVSFKKALNN